MVCDSCRRTNPACQESSGPRVYGPQKLKVAVAYRLSQSCVCGWRQGNNYSAPECASGSRQRRLGGSAGRPACRRCRWPDTVRRRILAKGTTL